MNLQSVIIWAVGVAVVIAAFRIFKIPLKLAMKTLLHTAIGFGVLIALDLAGVYTGIYLGVNLINSLVIGLLGAPGFGVLLMLKWLLVL